MTLVDKRKFLHSEINQSTINTHLDEIEAMLGRLDSKKSDLAENILDRMDLVDLQIKKINSIKNDQKSYDIQLEYIRKRIQSHAGIILKAIGGVDAYRSKRKNKNISPDSWWWYLDRWLLNKRRKQLLRASIITAVILTVLMVIGVLYNRFLAPPPEVRARMQHENASSSLVEAGDFPGAILELDQAIAYAPDDVQLRIQKGVLHLKLGENDKAEEEFQIAWRINEDPYTFYMERSLNEVQLDLFDEADLDTGEMLKYKPDSAEAYLLRGQLFEKTGENDAALAAYQKASDFADEQDNVEIITTVRLRMAFLMQTMMLPTSPK